MIKEIIRVILGKLYYLFCILPEDCYLSTKSFLGLSKEIEYEGNEKFGNKLCVFASFPINGKLSNNLKNYLSNLHNLGYSIIFVSNAEIALDEIEWLKFLCSKIIIRENFGRDVAAYKIGIMRYKNYILEATELLIANDSVIQCVDLRKMFDYMSTKNVDFWGVTESYDGGLYKQHHLCSYFLVISKKVIESKVFWDFWQNYRISQSRIHCIKYGEIYFSLVMQKAGFTMLSYINSSSLYKFLAANHDNLSHFVNNKIIGLIEVSLTSINSLLHSANRNSIINLLYSSNHNGIFLKAMMKIGLPLIKKDVFSKCNYYIDEISILLEECGVANVDEVIRELLAQVKPIHTLKDKMLMSIGEK